jgi:hypothetical protein
MNVDPCRRPGCGRKGKSKRTQLIGPFLGADYALLGYFIHVGRDIRIGQLGPFKNAGRIKHRLKASLGVRGNGSSSARTVVRNSQGTPTPLRPQETR